MTTIDTVNREGFDEQGEPIPPFKDDVPEKRFKKENSFKHPHLEAQRKANIQVKDELVKEIIKREKSEKPTHIQLTGPMGSGKSLVTELIINEMLELDKKVVVFYPISNRDTQLSRNNELKNQDGITWVPLQFPDISKDPDQRVSFFKQINDYLLANPIPEYSLVVMNESQWGVTGDTDKDEQELQVVYNTLENQKSSSVSDNLPRFFHGKSIPATDRIRDLILREGGIVKNLLACDSYNHIDEYGKHVPQVPSRWVFLLVDEEFRGGFASNIDKYGSHELRSLSLNNRKIIVDSILKLVNEGKLPPNMVEIFIDEQGNKIKTVRMISDPKDVDVMIGEVRYETTGFKLLIECVEILNNETNGILTPTLERYKRNYAEIMEA